LLQRHSQWWSAQKKKTREQGITMYKLAICSQVIIAVSIAFVWIVRFDVIVKEFEEYKIPDLVRNLVGATKIALSTLLIAGIWYPSLVLVPALTMAFLMLCAQVAHFRAKHPLVKYLPSLGLLILSLFVAAVYSGVLPK
jgi:hypothetical protein